MKAKRIKPIEFGRKGTAVWANSHGAWSYEKATGNLLITLNLFSEEQEVLETYSVLLPKEVTDNWVEDEGMLLAAFATKGIEIDSDYKEPIVEQPNVEGI